jgi:hypothetical protein
MTPIQACEETKELWTEMARIAREEKRIIAKSEVSGPWQAYKCNCPCCEYTGFTDCSFCPMQKEWTIYSRDIYASCEGSRSPYKQWRFLCIDSKALCIDVEFFCLLITELAEEAEMRHSRAFLLAESQSSLVKDKDIEYV